MDQEYDIIIAGAGPAGTLTAKHCAEKGLKVLVLEKRPEIGSPKRCAEGINTKDLERIGYTGKESFVAQEITTGYLYTPSGNMVELPGGRGGFVLERKVFDKTLAYDAAKAGAKIYTKAEVYDLIRKDGKIAGVKVIYNGEEKEIHSKVVVAADGVESKVAQMAGLKTGNTPHSLNPGHQYEMANIHMDNPHALYFYCGNDIAPKGYIWIFPKGEHIANVGIEISGTCEKTAKYYLDRWIESQPGISKGSIIEENAGGIPIGAFLKTMTADNFLAIGDAAHQVNPLHGGGLAESSHSADIASKIMIKAISSGDTSKESLDPYNRLWWDKRGKHLEKVEKVVKLYERLTDSEMEYIVSAITGGDVTAIAGGRTTTLMKVMMKNPRLLTLIKYIK